MLLRRGEHDAFGKRQFLLHAQLGRSERYGSIQIYDATLPHHRNCLEGRTLAALLIRPFEDFKQRDGWHH